MATDLPFWNGLMNGIDDPMFKGMPRDQELDEAEWKELFDQLRLMSGVYRTPLPSAHPCRHYKQGLRVLRKLEVTRWKAKEYKLSEDQLGRLTHYMPKVYKLRLINLMAHEIVKFGNAPSSSWKLPRFHEMVQMIWRDCVIQADAPVIFYDKVEKDNFQKFAALLAVWAKGEDEGERTSALESLQQYLQRQGLPNSPLVRLDQVKQDTRSTLDGSTLQSVLETGSIISKRSSRATRTMDMITNRWQGGSSATSDNITASSFDRVTLVQPET
jgi:hypothetical protein